MKGLEVLKKIANGEIKEESRFLDITDKNYYNGTSIHTFIYKNNNLIQEGIGGTNLLAILNHEFEVISDEIDIDSIEELDINNFGHNNMITQQETWYIKKTNELVQAVKQINKQIKELSELNIKISEEDINKAIEKAREEINNK